MGEAHSTLLGQMILSKDVYFGAALPEEAFPPGRLRSIYRAIMRRREAGDGVDIQLLADDLPDFINDIVTLTDTVPSAANWQFYAREVRKRWVADQIRLVGATLQEQCGEEGIVETAYARLAEIGDSWGAELHEARPMVHEYVTLLEERRNLRGRIPGLSTGFDALDHTILGFRPRMLYYVGARPTDGKTALLLNFTVAVCKAGHGVGFVSMESDRRELMGRLYANVGNINSRKLQSGMLQAVEMADVTSASEIIYDWSLVVCDRSYMSLQAIRSKAREMVRTHNVKVLCVDYMQLVQQTDNAQQFRLHMNEVSKGLKQLARELDVAVIAAAQLGRQTTGRPHLADFKETGQIEQDADVAILIWHDESTGSYLLVEKNRDGAKRDIPVTFVADKLRFVAREAG